MKLIVQFLMHYGYWVLFASVLTEQMGAPIPAVPVLLAMGALAGLGYFSFGFALIYTVVACLIADYLWYELGKLRGISVLRLLCRISLEPDSCVTNSQQTFEAQGARALLIAKFVPGLSTMAPPMAGLSGMSVGSFILLDTFGSLAWGLAALYTGYAFRSQLETAADWASRFGSGVGLLIGIPLLCYLGWKYYQRRRFLRTLRVARISPDELWRMIEAGEQPFIVDLRNAIEQKTSKIPTAVLFRYTDIDERHEEIPRDRDIILYCT